MKTQSGTAAERIARPPGSLEAPPGAHPTSLNVLAYGPDTIHEEQDVPAGEAAGVVGTHPVTWIDQQGLADVSTLKAIGEALGLHQLALEDTLNVRQRTKLDEFGDFYFIVAHMPIAFDSLETEQVSIYLGAGFLFTAQERPGDMFDRVRERIREGRPRLRLGNVDYLAYAILDALVDSYFPLLESIAERLDDLELKVLGDSSREHLTNLNEVKRDLITLRRYVEPLNEVVSGLLRLDETIISESTKVYLRDLDDHCSRAFELVESYRDVASGIMDLHLSMTSHQMNEVMRVLTIIATVFIPISFIAGLYGMNFDPEASRWNMPELSWAMGYPFAIGMMILCAGSMLTYFWKKGWFR